MQTLRLSFWVIILLLSNTFANDEIVSYAQQLCKENKQRMVNAGILTTKERLALDQEGPKIMFDFDEAQKSGNLKKIEACQLAFHKYIERFLALSEQAQ